MKFTFTYDDLLNAMGLKVGQRVRINNHECEVFKTENGFWFNYIDSKGYLDCYNPFDIIRKKLTIEIL